MTQVTRLYGSGFNLDAAAPRHLRSEVRGDVLTPDDDDYDVARGIFDGMIDKRPA